MCVYPFKCVCVCICELRVVLVRILLGGLLRLLHLSDEVEMMTAYSISQRAPCSSQEVDELLHTSRLWSWPSAVAT